MDALIRCAMWAPEGAYVKQSPHNGAWCIYHGVDRAGNPRLFERARDVDWETWRGEFTASTDAAMKLASDPKFERFGGSIGLLREAIDRLRETGEPEDLPRFVTAAALRALAAQETPE